MLGLNVSGPAPPLLSEKAFPRYVNNRAHNGCVCSEEFITDESAEVNALCGRGRISYQLRSRSSEDKVDFHIRLEKESRTRRRCE